MTKQINTGVAELLLVKVPDEKTSILEQFPNGYFFLHYGSPKMDRSGTVYLAYEDRGATHYLVSVGKQKDFPHDFDSLGIAHELTEKVWATLVDEANPELFDPFGIHWKDYEGESWEDDFSTATESGLSLLRANECYAVNPYGKDEPEDIEHLGVFTQLMRQKHKLWTEAQQNTGKWILLRKL